MNVHELTLQNYTAASGCPSACQPILYLGTAGSYGNEQINVVLGEGWQGLTVKAVFQPSGVPVVVPDGGGVISVPWEATQSVIAYPKGRISFQGYSSGRLVNTSDVPYAVGGSSAGSDNTPAPTPDEFQQFVDAVKSDADRAAQAAADAEAAVQEVKDAGTQAVTDIGNAKDSALEAIDAAREEAAGSISADVEGAKQAAADAEQSAADAEQSAKDAAATLEKVQSAGQSALADIATERQNTLSDIQNEGSKQQSAVAGAGTAALEAIGQTEQAAINQVRQAGATQASAVQSAGTTQISQVNSAGAAQVQAVKDEGAAQTAALNDAADAHKNELESVASHPPQPNTATGKWQVWNAETGAYQDTDALYQGGYYTPAVSDDGVLTWQGSQAGMPSLPSANVKGPQGPEGPPYTLTEGDKQTIVQAVIAALPDGDAVSYGAPEPGIVTTDNRYYTAIAAAIRQKLGTSTEYQPAQMAAAIESIGAIPGIPVTSTGNPVVATGTIANQPFEGLKIYGKSVQDGTPSPENPVPIVSAGDDGEIGLQITGKNLLDQAKLDLRQYNIYYGSVNSDLQFDLIAGVNYTLSIPDDVVTLPDGIYFYNAVDNSSLAEEYNSRSVSFKPNKNIAVKLDAYWAKGRPENATNLQLEVGSTATPYEPYKSQSLILSTPNGLPGIPVDSGGNYTDAEGQQWGCDVKDYGAGKYTQMVGHIESYNGENITTPYMSTTGQLSTGAEVYYVLDEPVVTDISADELTAYRALHTYDGVTVVSTAEDVAGLDVRYVANAQKYIDDRLAAAESHIQEIAAAQLNAQTGG